MPLVPISFRNQTTQTIDAPCYTHQWLSYIELCWAPSASTHSVAAPGPTGPKIRGRHIQNPPNFNNGISTSIHKLLTIQCNHESNSRNLIPKYKWNIMEEYPRKPRFFSDVFFLGVVIWSTRDFFKNPLAATCVEGSTWASQNPRCWSCGKKKQDVISYIQCGAPQWCERWFIKPH